MPQDPTERANEELRTFIYAVSHDLRSPLFSLSGFVNELRQGLQILLEQVPAPLRERNAELIDTRILESMGYIERASGRLLTMTNSLLELGRLGRYELQPEPLAFPELVSEILAGYAMQIREKNLTVHTDVCSELRADRKAVNRILANLLDNAVKFAPAEAGEVRVQADCDAGTCRICVSDNGPGMDPRTAEAVFEPFRRGAGPDIPGEGMGLAIVRSLARRLGGDVTVETTPGQGAEFTVIIPSPHPA